MNVSGNTMDIGIVLNCSELLTLLLKVQSKIYLMIISHYAWTAQSFVAHCRVSARSCDYFTEAESWQLNRSD